jgi:lysyl-tRNA synthetase class 1
MKIVGHALIVKVRLFQVDFIVSQQVYFPTMTHWADQIADTLLAKYTTAKDSPPLTGASGISPSGPVHVGNLRDLVTTWFVAKALKDRGISIRLIHSWDDFDRFRKVPKGVPDSYKEFIGKPLSRVPDPLNQYESYAAQYEKPFEDSIAEMGMEVTFLYQTALYESGIYSNAIREAIEARHAIYDILSRFKTQEGSTEEKESFFPITIYCERCGKDVTRVIHEDRSKAVLAYACSICKRDGEVNLEKANNVKLPWKVDWAMRWRHEHVIFEPGGKDHATAGGSFDVSSEIAKEVFHYNPPLFQPYEFIGLKGLTGKMSGSSGVLLTPADMLKIYPPEILLWIFTKTAPNKAFNLVLDESIYRVYDEFDKANEKQPLDRETELARIPKRATKQSIPVSFKQIANFSGVVQGNQDALEAIFDRMGTPCKKADFKERLSKAEQWLEIYAPEQRLTLLPAQRDDYFKTLSPVEQNWIIALHTWLKSSVFTLDEATQKVYDIPKEDYRTEEALSAAQRRFFQIVYNLLFGKERGPRLGTFFAAVPKESYLQLLHFP